LPHKENFLQEAKRMSVPTIKGRRGGSSPFSNSGIQNEVSKTSCLRARTHDDVTSESSHRVNDFDYCSAHYQASLPDESQFVHEFAAGLAVTDGKPVSAALAFADVLFVVTEVARADV
jgi:hypothetical protein